MSGHSSLTNKLDGPNASIYASAVEQALDWLFVHRQRLAKWTLQRSPTNQGVVQAGPFKNARGIEEWAQGWTPEEFVNDLWRLIREQYPE